VLRQATAGGLLEKQRLGQQEATEIRQLEGTLGANAAALAQQLNQVQQAETVERATTLKMKQDQYIYNRLSLQLTPSAIPGIGSYVVNNLIAAGIRTAADCINLNYRKIPSVGPRRVAAILAWRQSLESAARRAMPTALSPVEDSAITTKYAPSRTQLQSDLANAQHALATKQSMIQIKYVAARVPFDSQIAMEETRHSSELQKIQADSKRRQESIHLAILHAQQNANQAIAEVEKPSDAFRRAMQAAQWHFTKARLENGKFRSITLRCYMRKVAAGR
jgi:DNA-binding helix-hairpin-helix protein with protein kinase domain